MNSTDTTIWDDSRDALANAVAEFVRTIDPDVILTGFVVAYDTMRHDPESADGFGYLTTYTTSDGVSISQAVGMLAIAKAQIIAATEGAD